MNRFNIQGNSFQENYTEQANFAIADTKTFLSKVFSWMFLALGITAVTAYYFAANAHLMAYLIGSNGMTTLGWIVMFAPLGLVLIMSMGLRKLSFGALSSIYVAYSLLMGMSLSFILLIYSINTIFITFAITAGMFGFMALIGYTTKTDLTKLGSILFMGLIGIIIASVVNFFVKSSQMEYIISFIGVLVFTGLTAYDMQKLKRIGNGVSMQDASTKKLVIMGALTLYLDFINLFLFLLRLMGGRK